MCLTRGIGLHGMCLCALERSDHSSQPYLLPVSSS